MLRRCRVPLITINLVSIIPAGRTLARFIESRSHIFSFLDGKIPGSCADTPARLPKLRRLSSTSISIAALASTMARPGTGNAASSRMEKRKEKQPEKRKKRNKPPRYFGISAEINLAHTLSSVLKEDHGGMAVSEMVRETWQQLKKKNRIARQPHVTLVHSKSLTGEHDLWDRCSALDALDIPPVFKFRLGHIVANGRVMAATVDEIEVYTEHEDGEAGRNFLEVLPVEIRDRLHITVGTQESSISAVEAKALVQEWRKGKKEGIVEVAIEKLWNVWL
ncbi:hypothetical protein DENSPDRAFT_875234 [Dentipellis sp. KUC8613]|nr:hypothetical protein DENSPDRAFT_875234 [Dentipellis sp. KUC8613]